MAFTLAHRVKLALSWFSNLESLIYGILALGCLDVLMGPPQLIPSSALIPLLAVALVIRAGLLLATVGVIARMNDATPLELARPAAWLFGGLVIAVLLPTGLYLYGSEQGPEALALAVLAVIAFAKWMTQYELEQNGTKVIEG